MARKRKTTLPEPGAAFAYPLDEGRFGVCRVLGRSADGKMVLVANSAWIGAAIPQADEPALRPILHLTHHSWGNWRNPPHMLWISEPPPPELQAIGTIEPTPDEQAGEHGFGGWPGFLQQPLLQWRWDHERDAVLADDAIEQQAEEARRVAFLLDRQRTLAALTLDQLRSHRFFPTWKGYPPARTSRRCREIMVNTVIRLQELRPDAPEAARMALLQKCIKSFNRLNAAQGFIETDELEDISEEFERIQHACGLGAIEDLIDRWRDW